jgi:hypothetical protein
VADNCAAADVGPLPDAIMNAVAALYARDVKPLVHAYW